MLQVAYFQLAQSGHWIAITSLMISVISALFAGYKVISDRPVLQAAPFGIEGRDQWLDVLARDIKIKIENVGNRIARVKKVRVYFLPLGDKMELTGEKTPDLFQKAGYLNDVQSLYFDLLPKMDLVLTFKNKRHNGGAEKSAVFNDVCPDYFHVLVIDINYRLYRSIFYYSLVREQDNKFSLISSIQISLFRHWFKVVFVYLGLGDRGLPYG